MPVEIFTKAQFEDALPVNKHTGEPLWKCNGLSGGEYVYSLRINKSAVVIVRSSIQGDGRSAGSGEDSIRLWLADPASGKPLTKKLSRWIARTGDWRGRLESQLRRLFEIGLHIKTCNCGGQVTVKEVKKDGDNKGRLFASCKANCPESFKWLTESKKAA